MKCTCPDPVVFGCHCTKPWHGENFTSTEDALGDAIRLTKMIQAQLRRE